MSAPGWYPDPAGGPTRRYWDVFARWCSAIPAKTSGLGPLGILVIVAAVLVAAAVVVGEITFQKGAVDHDGVYLVGRDIKPGVWRTSGARADTKGIHVCVWERHRATPPTADNVIQVGGAGVGETGLVQIPPTDAVFSTYGCERWHMVSDDRG